ncbi:EAL domain-containing protein [Christensenella intestinihominis]|nr:sensor domain-containing phosphodiesterase [Christensenella intestinihominis]
MFDLIDEISELLYVSDPGTYELLYLNQAGRKVFGLSDISGKKCYEVLQGRDKPCEFCTNGKLSEDEFYVWDHYNPVVGRHYLVKDKLIPWQGKMARMEIALDVTEKEEQRIRLEEALETENLILSCVKSLHEIKHVNEAIGCIMERIGTALQADRVYIFEFAGKKMTNTYEWCAPLVVPQIENLKNMPVSVVRRWIEAFKENKCIYIEDIEEIKNQYPEEYAPLKAQEIKSLVVAPLNSNGRLMGYIGVDNPGAEPGSRIEPVLGTLGYFLASSIDRVRADIMLEKLSFEDVLTGLNNRHRFIRDIDKLQAQEVRSMGVVYLDINGLKTVNDRQGHAAGDERLKKTAELIRSVFPEENAYRIGGDEFVVCCPDGSEGEFEHKVFELRNGLLLSTECSASVGSKWAEGAVDVCRLITETEELMYENKKKYYHNQSVGRYRCYTDDTLELKKGEALVRALKENRFIVYFQPKVSVEDRSLIGAEALVRYLGHSGKIEEPDHFIPVLENARLISNIDLFVLDKTCEMVSEWLENGYRVPPVSVNFSRYTLLEKDFVGKISETWKRHAISQEMIEIEITESVEDVGEEYMEWIIREIKKAGFSVSIDDFGVKYANLALLKNVDIDTLKLDRSMLVNIGEQKKTCSLIGSVVQFCAEMGIQFIAEGVETEEQFRILQELKCTGAQGFLFGRPMPAEEYRKLLSVN